MKYLRIVGARTHNLKNIHLNIPRDRFVVLSGVSGSGKSSLAFDTLYAEGQRRYVESLSSYARQFLSLMDKPDVDRIEGLSPAISIEQKTTSHNPRSTVGTVTEIYDYLRVFFSRIGQAYCPTHGEQLGQQSVESIAHKIYDHYESQKIVIGARIEKKRFPELEDKIQKEGYSRLIVDGKIYRLDDDFVDWKKKEEVIVVIDRLSVSQEDRARLLQSLEIAFELGNKLAYVAAFTENSTLGSLQLLSTKQGCIVCDFSMGALEPRMFSFNSPLGSCESCKGLGFEYQADRARILQPLFTLNQGAIALFTKHDPFYFDQLSQICSYYSIDMDTVFAELSAAHQELLLYGDQDGRKIMVKSLYYPQAKPKKMVWPGVLSVITQRYAQSDQESVKEILKPFIDYLPCNACKGARLNPASRSVRVGPWTIHELCHLSISETRHVIETMHIDCALVPIAEPLKEELINRLGFLVDVGLGYLSLDRAAETLSGGESQRIRLASQLGSKLVGVMYILDEPSIGLHQRDNDRLIETLRSLVRLGNTLIVVEHDEDAIWASDWVVDLGPGAGIHGGEILAQGTPEEIANHPDSLTGFYLSGRRQMQRPSSLKQNFKEWIEIIGARRHNLKGIDVKLPIGALTCISGVSGSGKSSLINHTLVPYAEAILNGRHHTQSLKVESVRGLDLIDKMICIDQSPIGRTPRSNPATYTGLFSPIRDFFAQLPQSKSMGFKAGRFSFNVSGGRCERCLGDGVIRVEMHFLSDVYIQCEECQGLRYNQATLAVKYKNHHIADILNMTVTQALEIFSAFPTIAKKLQTLEQVGLGYIRLGQNATTLSGGEAQRIKLAKELARRDSGKTLYILDEPTTGLHFEDIQKLLQILFSLRDRGNTICIIEHNLDVINCADWVVDLGPDGGSAGGELIFQGPFLTFLQEESSLTAQFLRKMHTDREKRWSERNGKIHY